MTKAERATLVKEAADAALDAATDAIADFMNDHAENFLNENESYEFFSDVIDELRKVKTEEEISEDTCRTCEKVQSECDCE